MVDLVIFGTGGLTETVARDVIAHDAYRVVAFTVDAAFRRRKTFLGRPVVAFEEIERRYPPEDHNFLVVVTHTSDRFLAHKKVVEAQSKGYEIASFVHPKAIVAADVRWGVNTIVGPGAILDASSVLGDGVVVRAGAYVGHHCKLDSYCYIAPRAAMSGYVKVGSYAFVGLNATLRDRIEIGPHALIGCGVTILNSVPEGQVVKAPDGILLPVERDEVQL